MLRKLFGSSEPKEKKVLPWIPLTDQEQLGEIEERSKTKTQVIFKHSTRCGISRMVLKQFSNEIIADIRADLYYLDLLSYRALSEAVSHRFEISHQSPQVLVIKNGTTIANASHGDINNLELSKYI